MPPDERDAVLAQMAKAITEIQIAVAQVNGNVSALAERFTDGQTYTERTLKQTFELINERMNLEGQRSDDRHRRHDEDIRGIGARHDADMVTIGQTVDKGFRDMGERVDKAVGEVGKELQDLITERIVPLETESKLNRDWRNRVVGIAIGSAFGGGAMGGGVAALIMRAMGHG